MLKVTVKGKPTIFFSGEGADRNWRFTEKVVAFVEGCFQGADDSYTFSSIRLKNVVGEREQIDVIYSASPDPTDVFSFVEVRDRGRKVGRPYVQEIMGKRSTLGIDECVMVSTRGFSDNAIRLARHEVISLRTIRAISPERIRRWFRPRHFGVQETKYEIVECAIITGKPGRYLTFDFDAAKGRESNILVPADTNSGYAAISLDRVFATVVVNKKHHQWQELVGSLPKDDQHHKTTVTSVYDPPRFFIGSPIDFDLGNDVYSMELHSVHAVVFFTLVNRNWRDVPIHHCYEYIDAITGECLAECFCAVDENGVIGMARHKHQSDDGLVSISSAAWK